MNKMKRKEDSNHFIFFFGILIKLQTPAFPTATSALYLPLLRCQSIQLELGVGDQASQIVCPRKDAFKFEPPRLCFIARAKMMQGSMHIT